MNKKYRDCIDGILLLDKPVGISSNDALQKAKYLLNAQKAGHTGSLDPLASGMLPLCFGEATKFSRFILEERKCYQTVMHLGITTTTGDAEGEVLETKSIPALSEEMIAKMVAQFQGTQTQIPPMYSAIKHQGQPLYILARQGIEIERKSRNVMIYHLEITNITDNLISLTIECSSGTYIRTLVEDMGAYLGCGAHVVELRRNWVCPFQNNQMIPLDKLETLSPPEAQSILLPMNAVIPLLMPVVSLNENAASLLSKGQNVQVESDARTGWVALMTQAGFMGVGEMLGNGKVAPRRLIQQKSPICV